MFLYLPRSLLTYHVVIGMLPGCLGTVYMVLESGLSFNQDSSHSSSVKIPLPLYMNPEQVLTRFELISFRFSYRNKISFGFRLENVTRGIATKNECVLLTSMQTTIWR